MILLKPPTILTTEQQELGYPKIFLAGSIEMGKAEDWQTEVQNILQDTNIIVCSPRRDDWNKDWPQDANFAPFNEQVTWELDHIDAADIVLMYFDPTTKSPITLLELGILTTSPQKVLVCCPEGYWRKGNVDIVCQRYGISQVDTKDEFFEFVKSLADDINSVKSIDTSTEDDNSIIEPSITQ